MYDWREKYSIIGEYLNKLCINDLKYSITYLVSFTIIAGGYGRLNDYEYLAGRSWIRNLNINNNSFMER